MSDLRVGDKVQWKQVTEGTVSSVNPTYFTVALGDANWTFDVDEADQFEIIDRPDHSRGYTHGDVVLIRSSALELDDTVLRYNANDDAWYPATSDGHSCHNEFLYGEAVDLIRNGKIVRVKK